MRIAASAPGADSILTSVPDCSDSNQVNMSDLNTNGRHPPSQPRFSRQGSIHPVICAKLLTTNKDGRRDGTNHVWPPKKRVDFTSLVISLSINRPVTIGRSLIAWFVFLLCSMVTRLRSTLFQFLHHTRKGGVRYPLQTLRVSFLFGTKTTQWIYSFFTLAYIPVMAE